MNANGKIITSVSFDAHSSEKKHSAEMSGNCMKIGDVNILICVHLRSFAADSLLSF